MKVEDIINQLTDVKSNEEASGFQATYTDEKVIEALKKGDSRCEFKLGNKVKKKTFEKGDIHQIGHEGIITGSVYIEDLPEKLREAYLVKFELDEHECFTVGYKIELDK